MNKPKIILTGGSGFLGRSLAADLAAKGFEVVVVARSHPEPGPQTRWVNWDGRTVGAWAAEFEGAKAVVNLAGKNVNCRYTPANLREINESRENSVRVVAQAINACTRPPGAWVQAGSLAIYGDAGDSWCDEQSPHGSGIPVDTCLRWESAFENAATPGTRKVLLRISFVLGRDGGALKLLAGLTRCFLGGAIGSGRQFISWIHLTDMNRLWLRAVGDPAMTGIWNATSPSPVTNAEFMRELRRILCRPWCPPMPAFLVPVGCRLLGTEPVLALTGRRAKPARLMDAGFQFSFPALQPALRDIYGGQNQTGVTA